MRNLMLVLALVGACKMKPAEDEAAKPGKSGAMDPSGGAGSAMGTAMKDAAAQVADAAIPDDAAVAAAVDAGPSREEELQRRYEACLQAADRCGFSLRTDDVRYEAGLLLVGKDTIVAVLWLGGLRVGHAVFIESDGTFGRDIAYAKTQGARQSGFPRKVRQHVKNDDKERTNAGAFAKFKHKAERTVAVGDYVAAVGKKGLIIRRFENGEAVEMWEYD